MLLAGGTLPVSATEQPDTTGAFGGAAPGSDVATHRVHEVLRPAPHAGPRTPARQAPAPGALRQAPATSTQLAVGSFAKNSITGRREVVVPDIRRTAVLIGDSQSGGEDTWPQLALRELGYSVSFAGAGGTGFVAANESGASNYYDSLTSGAWTLPHGDPALIVLEGGGNDAGSGASDDAILASANGLILAMERTYPHSRMVMISTLSRSTADGGGRRAEVDALLGGLAELRGIPFVSTGDWLTTYGLEDLLADTVHLGPAGHQRAADLLEGRLAALKLTAEDARLRAAPASAGTGHVEPLE